MSYKPKVEIVGPWKRETSTTKPKASTEKQQQAWVTPVIACMTVGILIVVIICFLYRRLKQKLLEIYVNQEDVTTIFEGRANMVQKIDDDTVGLIENFAYDNNLELSPHKFKIGNNQSFIQSLHLHICNK